MSSGLQFMYGHMFGAQHRRPHIETVKAIRRSTIQPFVTSPIGVPLEVAQSNIHQGHYNPEPAPAPAPAPAPVRSSIAQPTRRSTARAPPSVSVAPAPAPAPSVSDIDAIIQMIQKDPALMTNEIKSADISPGQKMLERLAKKYNQNIDG